MAKTILGSRIVIAKRVEKLAHESSRAVELRELGIIPCNPIELHRLRHERNERYKAMRAFWREAEQLLYSKVEK